MPEYRRVPDDHDEAFQEVLRYAFRPQAGPAAPDDLAEAAASGPARVGEGRALYDGDELRCTCAHHLFEARLRGEFHDLGGVSAVATPPEHRRRGLVGRLLAAALEEYRDRDVHVSALWPFDHGFYRRMGWALVNRYASVECDPGALSFADDARAGRFRRAGPDDWAALDAVHRAHGEPYDLWLRRSEEWWRYRVFEGWEQDPYVYAWERDGEVRGYLVYDVEEEDDGRLLRVREAAAADHEAYLNLLCFCYDHDSQVGTVRLFGPPEPTLVDLVDDPSALDVECGAGPMFRLVDVAGALSALAYPEGAAGEVSLSVSDPLVDWNDGAVRLSVADGDGHCEPTDGESPDVVTDVNALSQLVAGYRPVETLERTADLSVETPAGRDLLAAAFPPREVFLSEGF